MSANITQTNADLEESGGMEAWELFWMGLIQQHTELYESFLASPRYCAHGHGYSGQSDSLQEAFKWARTNKNGAVYIRLDLVLAAINMLIADRPQSPEQP